VKTPSATLDASRPSWPALIGWLIVGLITTLPGLSTKSLHYDEALDVHLAQMPIASQYAAYGDPAARDLDQSSGLILDSPHLYHTVLHPFLTLFGTTGFTVRLLPWLGGGILVSLSYALLSSLFPTRLAVLGTLGFTFSAWRVELAQMGRPHSVFLAASMLGLILFRPVAEGRSRPAWLAYLAALVVAVQTSYWGILVVVPSHFVATLLLRRRFDRWRRAVAAQALAGATSLYYVSAILMSYGKHSSGDPTVSRALAIPLFGRSLVLFGAGEFGKLDVADLPLVVGITLIVCVLLLRGAIAWWRSPGRWPRWLGVCVGAWVALLFAAHFVARSLPAWPMERKFALLLVPLLITFVFGLQTIRSPVWRCLAVAAWVGAGAFFGLRSMTSNPFRDSTRMAATVAAQPRPVLVYSNRDLFVRFLIDQDRASEGVAYRRVRHDRDGVLRWRDVSPEEPRGSVCVCLIREGSYLRGRVGALVRGGTPPDVDGNMKSAVAHVTETFTASGWRPLASAYYPGRISYQVACFGPPTPAAEEAGSRATAP